MKQRLAIISGVRTPFCKAPGHMKGLKADDFGAYAVKELMHRSGVKVGDLDELIFGNVIQPTESANLARILAVKAGIPLSIPSYTVNRNCASGMEAITTSANKILSDEADSILCGGTESMSNGPVLFGEKMVNLLLKLKKAKSTVQCFQFWVVFDPIIWCL